MDGKYLYTGCLKKSVILDFCVIVHTVNRQPQRDKVLDSEHFRAGPHPPETCETYILSLWQSIMEIK